MKLKPLFLTNARAVSSRTVGSLKSRIVICLALGLPLTVLGATADPHGPVPNGLDAASLGRLDAVLTLCIKADTKNSETYARYRAEMIVFGEGTSSEMRAPGSATPEYKEAYAAMLGAAGKAGAEELVSQCRRTIGADGAENRN